MRDVSIFLQARSTSTRLPGKIFLPLEGRPLIERIFQRLKGLMDIASVCVATIPRDLDRLSTLALPYGIRVIEGPEDDVLARFVLAAKMMRPEIIVRCTADNPLVFADGIRIALAQFDAAQDDYLVMDSLPYGAGFEILTNSVLKRAALESRTEAEREHVTPYIYHHPELFRLKTVPAPEEVASPKLRVTVDTQEDYDRMCGWYRKYMDLKSGLVDLSEVVKNESP